MDRDPVGPAGRADVDQRIGVFFPRGAKVVTPGCTMRMAVGKPIATEGMRSADRGDLTRRLEEAVRATFTTEV